MPPKSTRQTRRSTGQQRGVQTTRDPPAHFPKNPQLNDGDDPRRSHHPRGPTSAHVRIGHRGSGHEMEGVVQILFYPFPPKSTGRTRMHEARNSPSVKRAGIVHLEMILDPELSDAPFTVSIGREGLGGPSPPSVLRSAKPAAHGGRRRRAAAAGLLEVEALLPRLASRASQEAAATEAAMESDG